MDDIASYLLGSMDHAMAQTDEIKLHTTTAVKLTVLNNKGTSLARHREGVFDVVSQLGTQCAVSCGV